MNFDESVKYLYGLGNEVLAMKLGLENIGRLLAALGDPQKKYLKVQVAGTNGKGSTCAFLESICLQAKIKTGMTTSPHLISVTERVRIGGAEIGETDFARHATIVRETSENLVKSGELETVPTFFEQVTAIALHAFAANEVELAILETGLGGRFDATTAARAEIVAITPVDFDHQRILGNSLEEIAAEKAAIIRDDTKVVVAAQPEAAIQTIMERCANFGVTPKLAKNVDVESIPDFRFQISNFQTAKAVYQKVKLNLLGKHQIENAKTAILLAEILQDYFHITQENIVEGLQTAVHKGRLEFQGNYLFDGAHNVSGAVALREFLDESVSQPVTLVFGAMRDKNLAEIAKILFPAAKEIIITAPENPRSMSAVDLYKSIRGSFERRDNIFITEGVESALKLAEDLAKDEGLICVTGSLYLVGEAQKILGENQSQFLTD